MENQNNIPEGFSPIIDIKTGVENMIDAFGIPQERYDAMHKLVGSIISGDIEGISYEREISEGRYEKGIDIAGAISYIQQNAHTPTEFVLGSFFFGSAMGQLIERVRMQAENRFEEGKMSIREAILKAAKEAGHEVEIQEETSEEANK